MQQREAALKTDRNGEKNPAYNTCWIYSDSKRESRKINKSDVGFWIGSEWKLGRKMKF